MMRVPTYTTSASINIIHYRFSTIRRHSVENQICITGIEVEHTSKNRHQIQNVCVGFTHPALMQYFTCKFFLKFRSWPIHRIFYTSNLCSWPSNLCFEGNIGVFENLPATFTLLGEILISDGCPIYRDGG